MEIVSVKGVCFQYPDGRQPVLDDVDLSVKKGDFLGLIGPNGGGKTTLLRLLLGILRPQEGEILIAGKSPGKARSKVGYVSQHAGLDTSVPVTVEQVVMLGGLSQSPWGPCFGKESRKKARETLMRVGLEGFEKRSISALSGGERQRVLLARSLMSNVELLLLDEPTAGVDLYMEEGIFELLARLNKEMTIVIVSHDVGYISNFVNHVACLNRRLVCHEVGKIDSEAIRCIYGHTHNVRAVKHYDDCPLPGEAEGE